MLKENASRDRGGHVAETVEQLSQMHAEHAEQTTSLQRIANGATAILGRPAALAVLIVALIIWTGGNYLAKLLGLTALEEFPYAGVEFLATVAALLIALLILTTQQHQDQLADRRAQLTLQLATLSEKKIAKVIELLEEQRRDNPLLPGRADTDASEMAKSVDPGSNIEHDTSSPGWCRPPSGDGAKPA